MVTRFLALIMAMGLVPVLAMGQRGTSPAGNAPARAAAPARSAPAGVAAASARPPMTHPRPVGGGAPRSGAMPVRVPSSILNGGFGGGISTGGLGGNMNISTHASGVPAPGFPGVPGSGERRLYRGRSFNHGNTVIIGVPYAVPYYSYPFTYYGYSSAMVDVYGNPMIDQPVNPAPNVIVIQPNGDQAYVPPDEGAWGGPSIFVAPNAPGGNSGVVVYQPSAAPPEAQAKPLILLVFKDHSIYAVTDYWKDSNRLCYTTNYGSQNCAPVDQVDVDLTKKLNAERNIAFELP
jgi:hypothetical protein